ncbi:MAG: acyltransferase family protein, partial [Chitinophagaceae bacterium]
MNRLLSQKFRFLTFICIALLPYIHGYNLNETYLSPFSTVNEPLTITTFFEYFIANGILRFRIPVLFIISGYLYAQFDNQPYLHQIKKRFITLIIPFLLWSAIGLLITYLFQQFSFTAKAVLNAELDQFGNNAPYSTFSMSDLLERWLLAPPAFQLWFIQSLFFYNLLYPIFKWFIKKIPVIWLIFTCLLWFSLFGTIFIGGMGLFYFSLGIWLQQKNFSLNEKPKWFNLGLAWIFFIGVCVIKTFMAFELAPEPLSTTITILVLYNLSVVVGILCVWYSVNSLSIKSLEHPFFKEISKYSFF